MDYMKGYNTRRNRRRKTRSRINTPNNDIINSGYYRSKSKYIGNSPATAKRRGILIGVSVVFLILLFISVFLLATRKSAPAPIRDGERVVSDSAAEAMAAEKSMKPDGVAKEVASVPTLAPEAICTPAPTPRPKAVALTFDDGPRSTADRTPKVLQMLKKYNAHATFFVVGQSVAANADVLKQEVAQGCEIANHSWDHTNLSTLSMKKVNKQYNKTANLVKKLIGYDIKLLRPPYGAISDKMRKSLKHPMVLWNVDTLDWQSKDPKAILKKVKKNVKDGDIILMHDIHPTSATALEKVLPWLVKNGYDILTVSELAERKGVKMSNGKAYGGFY